jgi:acetyltransferase-like isoleucine patch superfamily enzyme
MNQPRHVGKDVVIREWVRFVRPDNIHIGNHVMIDDFVLLSGGREELTEIGDYVHIACFSSIIGSAGVTMRDFSGLSPGCRLFSETDDYVDGGLINPTVPLKFRRPRLGRITLEKYVTLGADCVVLPGVTLGEGATVGACSLVTGDLEPWTVNIGIPAKPIKKRNREEVLRRAEMVLKQGL